MTRNTPNKRKSLAAGETSPKKAKGDPRTLKPANTPKNTPKSAKKPAQIENGGTPKAAKTPKSAKKNQKLANGANTPKPEAIVPESPEKSESEESEVEVPQPKTPKSAKKEPKTGEKLQKFGGMKALEEKLGSEAFNKLNRTQKRRLLRKLKKKELSTDGEKTVAEKTVAELNESPSQKNIKKKNKKTKNILNKSVEGQVQNTPAGKKSPKNKKGKGKAVETIKNSAEIITPSEDSNDSDYEVESQIKPEKVTKSLNIPVDDEDYIVKKTKNKDVFDSSKPEKEQKNKRDEKSPNLKQTLDIKDLNKSGIMKKGQTRYVLYVNNIPYDVNKDNIKEHFAKACQLKDVRIPTDKTTKKPKGFCYVELSNEEEYQKALALHHTFMNGRRINVVYTTPGKKNSEEKKKDIKKKNLKLQGMRKKGMFPGAQKDSQKRSVRRAKKKTFENKQSE